MGPFMSIDNHCLAFLYEYDQCHRRAASSVHFPAKNQLSVITKDRHEEALRIYLQ